MDKNVNNVIQAVKLANKIVLIVYHVVSDNLELCKHLVVDVKSVIN